MLNHKRPIEYPTCVLERCVHGSMARKNMQHSEEDNISSAVRIYAQYMLYFQ